MYQQLRKLWSKSFVDLRCHHFGLSDADMDRIEKEG
jgi:predicted Zn-dependent protease with MMP-like domain